MAVKGGARRPALGWTTAAVLFAASLSPAMACRRAAPPPTGKGLALAAGEVLALRPSADGRFLAWLGGCQPQKDRTLPPGTASCDLSVVAVAGGVATRVARGVSTLPHGFTWSQRGAILTVLADYDHGAGRGTLVLWSGGEPRQFATDVSFQAVARDGSRLGWAETDGLHVAELPAGAPARISGTEGVSTFELSEGGEGVSMLGRRSGRGGGQLLAVRAGKAREVAAQVRDYGFDAAGARFAVVSGEPPALRLGAGKTGRLSPPLAREVSSFAFAPGGEAVAFVAGARPGRQGDLWVAGWERGPARVGRRAGEARWSLDGGRLAWLEDYDPRSRTGTLTTSGRGEKPLAVARNVSDFDLSRDGRTVAYLVHETAGGYSVDLGLARAGEQAPAKVARGVFGFSLSPDGAWLLFRSRCVREAEACDLSRVPVGGSAAARTVERLAEGVKSYEHAPGRPGRLLVSWARKDRVALDLALWEDGKLTAVDTYALPGSAHFLPGDPTRLAYAVVDPRRRGVYLAEVP